MFKRSVAVGLSALVLLTSASVADAATSKKPAAKPTKRTVTWNYQALGGAGVAASFGGTMGDPCANPGGCYTLKTQKWETKVAFTVADSQKLPVAIAYYFDGDAAHPAFSCGDGSFTVAKGTTVSFRTIVDPAYCQGAPTQGHLSITVTGKK